ncbi:hypothetical protein SCOR_34625 [Sulfidibacter corallicola]
MNHFGEFIEPMNLPGTTDLAAFGDSEQHCFERNR